MSSRPTLDTYITKDVFKQGYTCNRVYRLIAEAPRGPDLQLRGASVYSASAHVLFVHGAERADVRTAYDPSV